jgi:hypothetical protein
MRKTHNDRGHRHIKRPTCRGHIIKKVTLYQPPDLYIATSYYDNNYYYCTRKDFYTRISGGIRQIMTVILTS